MKGEKFTMIMVLLLTTVFTFGVIVGKLSTVEEVPEPNRTTLEYNELWELLKDSEKQHQWSMNKKEIKYLKKLKCKNIMVRFADKDKLFDGLFMGFSTVDNYGFIKLKIGNRTKNYAESKILPFTYRVECEP